MRVLVCLTLLQTFASLPRENESLLRDRRSKQDMSATSELGPWPGSGSAGSDRDPISAANAGVCDTEKNTKQASKSAR